METHVNNWGNSLGIRLPKILSEEIGISNGSPIDITVRDGGLFIKPIAKGRRYTLKELLAQVPEGYERRTDEDVQEWLNAPSVGKEIIDDDWS